MSSPAALARYASDEPSVVDAPEIIAADSGDIVGSGSISPPPPASSVFVPLSMETTPAAASTVYAASPQRQALKRFHSAPHTRHHTPLVAWAKSHFFFATLYTIPLSFLLVLGTSAVASIYALAYLGVLWDPQSNLPNVKVGFLNADAGFNFTGYPTSFAQAVLAQTGGKTIGQIVESTILDPSGPTRSMLSWESIDGVSRDDAIDRVNNNELWNVIYIPANFSSAFLLNFNFGKPSTSIYTLDIETIYDQSRQMTVNSLLNAELGAIFKSFSGSFSRKFVASVNSAPNSTIWLTPPTIQLVPNNLHPIPNLGHNFATYAICIVLWLSGMVTASLMAIISGMRLPYLRQHHVQDALNTPTRIMLSAQIISMLLAFLQALVAWGIYCAFVGSATSGFNPDYSPFVILLYLWFIAVSFHAIASTLCILIGKDYYPLPFSMLLILQLATSSSILDPDVMVGFGKITYAFPFYYANRSLKCMMLGSSCKFVPLNTSVIAAWWAAMLVVTFVMGRRYIIRTRRRINKAAETSV
ncbi:hypothetical protein HK105_200338 [Polyrhizophydium stewartii]|uniref:DUF3533 domain-containing protein n=1 Tax=Polyrhizophydium stewartii TaxID=2732419 RepID=A0ABR4NL50_9FUNG